MTIKSERKKELVELTQDWKSFVENLSSFNEEECEFLLEHESKNGKRDSVVVRLFGRHNKLKRARELKALRVKLNPEMFRRKSRRAATTVGA